MVADVPMFVIEKYYEIKVHIIEYLKEDQQFYDTLLASIHTDMYKIRFIIRSNCLCDSTTT